MAPVGGQRPAARQPGCATRGGTALPRVVLDQPSGIVGTGVQVEVQRSPESRVDLDELECVAHRVPLVLEHRDALPAEMAHAGERIVAHRLVPPRAAKPAGAAGMGIVVQRQHH